MSIEWEHGPPKRWADLLTDAARAGTRGVLPRPDEWSRSERAFPAKRLGLGANPAASAIVQLGPDETRADLAPVLPFVGLAAEELSALFPISPWQHGAGFLSFVNALECCAAPVPTPMAGLPARDWLTDLARKPARVAEDERLTTALAGLALGVDPPVAAAVVGRGKLPTKLKPGQQHYDDLPGYVRYLAAAVQQGTPAADVEPAWRAFVWSFPTLEPKLLVWWTDLLWAARVQYAVLGGRAVGEVGAALHDFVRTL